MMRVHRVFFVFFLATTRIFTNFALDLLVFM